MGLFRGHKEHSKEPSPSSKTAVASPTSDRRRVSNARLRKFGQLFAEENDDGASNLVQTVPEKTGQASVPTIDMDELGVEDVVKVKGLAQIAMKEVQKTFEDDVRQLAAVSSPSNQRGMAPQNIIRQKASSNSMMTTRDSIKRSISKKVARSENRQHSLLLKNKDSHEASITSGGVTPKALSPRGDSQNNDSECSTELKQLSLSRTSSFNKKHIDDIVILENNVPKESGHEDFEKAYSGDDQFLVEAATRDDFFIQPVTVLINESSRGACDPYSNSTIPLNGSPQSAFASPAAESSLPKKRKSMRPPPLINADCGLSSADPSSDWPHTSVFAQDGGFMTGGFKITSEGMVGKPPRATREDSDSHMDGEVPQSDRNLIIVRSLNEFTAGPTIGAGAAGRVYLAEHVPSKRTMALKVVNVYDKEKRNQLLKELETLSTYVSRYLVRFYGAFYDGSGAVHIALEYMDHGCLSTFVQRVGAIPEKVVQMIAIDCLRGLRFLHRNHVLHRDFKTANILLSRRLCCAKLSDFGLARDMNPGVSRVETFVGTVAYMSPERLEGSQYTYASDIWALGVSMVECMLGRYPFEKPQNYFDYIEATLTANMWSSCKDSGLDISSQARDFITQCTFAEPKQRPKATELLDHPWLAGVKKDNEMFGSWLDHCRIKSMQIPTRSRGTAGR